MTVFGHNAAAFGRTHLARHIPVIRRIQRSTETLAEYAHGIQSVFECRTVGRHIHSLCQSADDYRIVRREGVYYFCR